MPDRTKLREELRRPNTPEEDALDEDLASIRDEPELTEHEVMLGLARAMQIDTGKAE